MTRERETIALIEALIEKLPVFDPHWSDEMRKTWLDWCADLIAQVQALSKAVQILALGPGEGLRLVPVEPTEEMLTQGALERGFEEVSDRQGAANIYRAMLSAAPSPPIPNGEENQELSPSRDLGPASAAQEAADV